MDAENTVVEKREENIDSIGSAIDSQDVETSATATANEQEKEDSVDDEDDGMGDLFGDDEEDNEDKSESDNETSSPRGRRTLDMDEEEEMYTRKFYGEDINNVSDQEDLEHRFKEEDVELVKHIVPYKVSSGKKNIESNNDTSNTGKEGERNSIYYAKVPAFLMVDPVPFDPPSFEDKVKERLENFSSKEDQLGDRLIDENTVRWRYSRDANQKVYRESNTQIVQWSDGSFSLKLGDEYTDILVNDTDNTFLAVSHDQQELMQCVEGGEVKKTLMFIPTSTNSKIHQRLSRATARRNQRESAGPGSYIINVDPEIEKKELEKKQEQIVRERRRRQIRERELLESPDTTVDSLHEGGFGRRRNTPSAYDQESRGGRRRPREDEYEEDDFLVDDDEEEEDYGDEEEEEEEEEEIDEEEEERERERAARLKTSKRSGSPAADAATSGQEEESNKRRKVAVISDDEED